MAITFGMNAGPLFKHSRSFEQGIGTRGIRAGAGTFVVAQDGSGDFTKIDRAIDALPTGGGVVYVKEGSYGSVSITDSNVAVIGSGKATTVTGITISSHKIYISQLNINASGDYGIRIIGGKQMIKIESCWIHDASINGIHAYTTAGLLISGNYIYSNSACGVYLQGVTDSSCSNNWIYNNSRGIELDNAMF